MITARHQKAIRTIYETLKDLDITWTITGSLGFALHGMDVGINDNDLQTDKDGAYQIEDAFQSNVIRKVTFSEAEGMRLPVLSLSYEEQAYRKLGRTEKADKIKEWLTKRCTCLVIRWCSLPAGELCCNPAWIFHNTIENV
ncbi:hypothetical protein ES703_115828 [subsurface metagenome]